MTQLRWVVTRAQLIETALVFFLAEEPVPLRAAHTSKDALALLADTVDRASTSILEKFAAHPVRFSHAARHANQKFVLSPIRAPHPAQVGYALLGADTQRSATTATHSSIAHAWGMVTLVSPRPSAMRYGNHARRHPC